MDYTYTICASVSECEDYLLYTARAKKIIELGFLMRKLMVIV